MSFAQRALGGLLQGAGAGAIMLGQQAREKRKAELQRRETRELLGLEQAHASEMQDERITAANNRQDKSLASAEKLQANELGEAERARKFNADQDQIDREARGELARETAKAGNIRAVTKQIESAEMALAKLEDGASDAFEPANIANQRELLLGRIERLAATLDQLMGIEQVPAAPAKPQVDPRMTVENVAARISQLAQQGRLTPDKVENFVRTGQENGLDLTAALEAGLAAQQQRAMRTEQAPELSTKPQLPPSMQGVFSR